MARTFLEGLASGFQSQIPNILAARQRREAEEKRTKEALAELKARYPQLFEEFAASRATLKDSPIIPQEDPSGIPPLPMTQEQAAAAPQQTIPFDESTLTMGDISGLMGRFARQREEAQYEKEKQYREDQAAAGRERLAQEGIMDKFERAQENKRSVASRAALRGEKLSPEKLADLDMYRDAFLAEDSLPLDQRRLLMQDYKSGVADLGLQVDKSVYDQEQGRLEAADFGGAFANAEDRFKAMFRNREGVRKEGGISKDDIDTVTSALAKVYPNLSKSRISQAIESAAEIVAPEFPIPKISINQRVLEKLQSNPLHVTGPNIRDYDLNSKEVDSLAKSPKLMSHLDRYRKENQGQVPPLNDILSGKLGQEQAIRDLKDQREQDRMEGNALELEYFDLQNVMSNTGVSPARKNSAMANASKEVRQMYFLDKAKKRYEEGVAAKADEESQIKRYKEMANISAGLTGSNMSVGQAPIDPSTGLPKWQFFLSKSYLQDSGEPAAVSVEVIPAPTSIIQLTPLERDLMQKQQDDLTKALQPKLPTSGPVRTININKNQIQVQPVP
jgi:hypothetical protein